ncbi:hypothetical protein CRG98_049708 [Punica granatum]|uniref:Uncharacterized protein n=1 Tax=Punica granatum TaxID=22663 RepID=A0A2I0H3V7_PUNGR|nr:hypothetical protein CRG98_049708 [Punica granatum]
MALLSGGFAGLRIGVCLAPSDGLRSLLSVCVLPSRPGQGGRQRELSVAWHGGSGGRSAAMAGFPK